MDLGPELLSLEGRPVLARLDREEDVEGAKRALVGPQVLRKQGDHTRPDRLRRIRVRGAREGEEVLPEETIRACLLVGLTASLAPALTSDRCAACAFR